MCSNFKLFFGIVIVSIWISVAASFVTSNCQESVSQPYASNVSKVGCDHSLQESNVEADDDEEWQTLMAAANITVDDSDKGEEIDLEVDDLEADEGPSFRVKRWDHRRRYKKELKVTPYKTTKVMFGFSRKTFRITDPKNKRSFKCGDKTVKLDLTKYRHGQWKKEYTIVANEMQNSIVPHKMCASHGGCFKRYNIKKIYKLNNKCLWTSFKYERDNIFAANKKRFSNVRMLWHGSKNVDDIVDNGMNEGWSDANNMFGAGLYFAEHSSKANQYLWGEFNKEGCPVHKDPACKICERKLLLARVVLGRSKVVYSKKTGQINPDPGYDSIVAKPKSGVLAYAEYIVYKGSQVYPEYLVTYTIQ